LQGAGAGQGPPGQPLRLTATLPGGILFTSRDVQDTPFACHRGRPGAAWPALVGPGRPPPEHAGFDDDAKRVSIDGHEVRRVAVAEEIERRVGWRSDEGVRATEKTRRALVVHGRKCDTENAAA
jgi:hypothetical protein